MKQFGLMLPAKGLANIPSRKEQKDFEFIVGVRCLGLISCGHDWSTTFHDSFAVHTEDRKCYFEAFLSHNRSSEIFGTPSAESFVISFNEKLANVEVLKFSSIQQLSNYVRECD
jgi:hypothetical protein